MGTNPYIDENGQFYVLVNDEDQYSVWPKATEVPAGWRVVFGPDGRAECLAYVEDNWSDMTLVSPPELDPESSDQY